MMRGESDAEMHHLEDVFGLTGRLIELGLWELEAEMQVLLLGSRRIVEPPFGLHMIVGIRFAVGIQSEFHSALSIAGI